MKVHQLKDELKQLCLSESGRKIKLKEIEYYIGRKDNKESAEEETTEDEQNSEADMDETNDEESESEAEHNEERTGRRTTRRMRNRDHRAYERRLQVVNLFSIKYVMNSIVYFTGDDKLSVEKWLDDFENLSSLLEWNELQKVIYGKRMLRGSAKRFITYEKSIKEHGTRLKEDCYASSSRI